MANGTLAASQLEMLSQDGTGIITITPPATNTNRAITLPDAAGEVVTNSATQTLTNKTIEGGALTLATAVTASGTAVDFTSIPSWVKRITVILSSVSTNGTSRVVIQIGNGSVETTGYSSKASSIGNSANNTNSSGLVTNGFVLDGYANDAAKAKAGSFVLNNIEGNTWVCTGVHHETGSSIGVTMAAGNKTTSAAVDVLRVTTQGGTNTFDAGSINIMYEG